MKNVIFLLTLREITYIIKHIKNHLISSFVIN